MVFKRAQPGLGRIAPLALGLPLLLASFPASWIEAANSSLIFTSAPAGEARQDTVLRFTVASRNPADTLRGGCGLYAGPVPSGSNRAGHPQRIAQVHEIEGANKTRILTFRPSDPDTSIPGKPAKLPLGIHYLVAACPDTSQNLTPELPLRVVTTQAPSISTPRSTETNARPEISWSAVPGVPAYHLLLSDQALQIDASGGVSGASVIWQAIVTGTRITYGTPDPSGNFSQVPAPPLSPGVPYNLVVLNNYDGRSALATSTRTQGLRLFSLTAGNNPPGKPRIVAPAKGASLAAPKDSQVVFRWTASQGGEEVNIYRLFIYAADNQQGNTVLLPVWQGDFTDTTARLDAQRTLLSQRYIAKVFAVSASGLATVSDTVSFAYTNKVQTLSLAARGPNGAGDTVFLDNVRVNITPITGSGQPFPLYTVGNQRVEKVLSMGSYTLEFTKEGYLPDRRELTLNGKATLQVNGFLSLASCLIQARAVGDDGQPLDHALARFESESGSPAEARSDAAGRLAVGVKPGRYRLSLTRDDYSPRPDTTLDVAAGQTIQLGNLMLRRASGVLTGTVASDAGPLPGAQVAIHDGEGVLARTLLTDGSGRFQAQLTPGIYTVAATYAGMVGSPQSLNLKQSAEMQFLLETGASIIRGRIRLQVAGSTDPPAPVQGALVTLLHVDTETPQTLVSDVNGEYSFSTAETGDFQLLALGGDGARSDTVDFSLDGKRATVERDLLMRALLQIRGDIRLQPDTAMDAAEISVVLLDDDLDKVVRNGRVYRDTSGLHFLIESVPDGEFRLSATGRNYATEIEPLLLIEDGEAPAKPVLTLARISGSLVFSLRGGDSALAGQVTVLSPVSATLAAGDTLKPAGYGTYILAATPEDSARLPLLRASQIVTRITGRPTEVLLQCPFAHRQAPEKQSDGRYLFLLQEDFGLDSGYLFVETQTGLRQTVSLRGSDAKLNAGLRNILVRPPPGATRLTYWFVAYQRGALYANDDPGRRYQLPLFKPGELAEIRIDVGDTMPVPAHARSLITVTSLDAQGRSLDSLMASKGTLKWRHIGKQALSLRQPQGNKLTLDAGAAPQSDRTWDTLVISAALDSQERGTQVVVRIADAKINALRMTTSLGDAPQIDAPRPVGLRLLAFDTTFNPPLPLLPNPGFFLDPPEAGKLRGAVLDLDSAFIGPLRVRARHTFANGQIMETELLPGEDEFSGGLNVGQTLRPKAKARLLRHGRNLSLSLPDSLVLGDAATVVRLYRRYLPKTFTSLKEAAVAGDVWEVTHPSGAPLRGHMILGLTVPAAMGQRRNAFRRFDAMALSWMPVDTLATEFDGRLRPVARGALKALDGNYWAILSASADLEASDLRIIPNPFSPRVTALRDGNDKPGARIRFRPDSRESPEVTITLALFTLEGERIRLLADHQTYPKAPIDFYWDGRNDDGRMARNGRYLLSLTLTPTGGGRSKQYLRPVVVFQ